MASVEEIQELLRKADGRRASEGGDTRKWNKILENLEASLDAAKSRADISKLDLVRLEREIEKALDEDRAAQNRATALQDETGPAEPTPEVPPGDVPDSGQDDPHRRTQFVLRAAIDKIQTNQLDKMTPAEIQVIYACCKNLNQMSNPTPKNERLKRIITAAIKILERREKK